MANGTVPLAPGMLQKPINQSGSTSSNKTASKRTVQPRLKLLIRRLPPGLTENEFVTDLGSEWKIGAGKVDWLVYRHGKVSKDSAKPSRPARAYLHVVDASLVHALSDKVRQTTFQDAKNTTKDLALLGPPAVEFAPYTKMPASRKRKDARQGTIDQDPEFMAFLDSLTNPIQKPSVELEPSQKPEKWTSTPLIDHLREKKAKKDKPASSKSSKKDTKEASKTKSKEAPSAATIQAAVNEKSKKPAKATKIKEAVKVLNRQEKNASPAPVISTNPATSPSNKEAVKTSTPERRRERPAAQFNLAAKIQRDLGLNPAPRRAATGSKDLAATSTPSTPEAKKEEPVPAETSTRNAYPVGTTAKREIRGRDRRNSKPTKPEASKADVTSSVKSVNQETQSSTSTKAANISSATSNQSAKSSGSTFRAFVKHANASQGVTEALLEAALATFGPVNKVEIDPKKGIAFANFESSHGLAAAVAKGKIEVGKSVVIIAEYRERAARTSRTPAPAANAANTISNNSAPAGSNAGGDGSRGRGSRGRGGRGRVPSSQVHNQKAGPHAKSGASTNAGGTGNISND